METALTWPMAVMSDSEARELDPDARLMLRFKEGDAGAFEQLFARHSRAIVHFAYRFVRNREVAEELAQEVFLKVFDASGSYRVEAKFTTWLYRIATNVCLNEVRRPHFRARHESMDAPSADDPDGRTLDLEDVARPRADVVMERRAIAVAIRAALEALPDKQRLAFVLNKYQELSYAEVAEVMETSEKAVKSLIHRAKEALAARLEPLQAELLA